jgi:hypothetical protein
MTSASLRHSAVTRTVSTVLGIWLAAVFALGAAGAFVRPPEAPPLPILLGVTLPIAAFLFAYRAFPAFRDYVLSADLRLLTAIQGWRAGGLGFLALYVHGVLPGLFAWPAGLGDIAVGITAPFIAAALIRNGEYAGSRTFAAWNLLGILDLVVAVSLGALSAGLFPALSGEVTTAPMSQLPLVLIPAYFVPLFVVLHLTALFQGKNRVYQRQHSDPAAFRAHQGAAA